MTRGLEETPDVTVVAEQRLDDADIDAILEQVRGEAVPQGVRANPLGDIRSLSRSCSAPPGSAH